MWFLLFQENFTFNEENRVGLLFYYFTDMINMLKLDFTPSTGEWIHPVSDPQHTIAVADAESPKIYIFDGHGTNTPLHMLDSIHTKPVSIIKVLYSLVMGYYSLQQTLL